MIKINYWDLQKTKDEIKQHLFYISKQVNNGILTYQEGIKAIEDDKKWFLICDDLQKEIIKEGRR